MSDEPLDPELRPEPNLPDLAGMFDAIAAETVRKPESAADRVRTARTSTRRWLALGLTIAVVVTAGAGALRADISSYPPVFLAVYLACLGGLLGAAVHGALRPIYEPPRSRLARVLQICGTLGAAVILAVLPGFHDHAMGVAGAWSTHVTPCFGWGFLVGLPVYFVLRWLDRDRTRGRLLSAAAAGLAGNMALELHCPVGGVEHLMLGHVAVVFVYIGGVFVIDGLLRVYGATAPAA